MKIFSLASAFYTFQSFLTPGTSFLASVSWNNRAWPVTQPIPADSVRRHSSIQDSSFNNAGNSTESAEKEPIYLSVSGITDLMQGIQNQIFSDDTKNSSTRPVEFVFQGPKPFSECFDKEIPKTIPEQEKEVWERMQRHAQVKKTINRLKRAQTNPADQEDIRNGLWGHSELYYDSYPPSDQRALVAYTYSNNLQGVKDFCQYFGHEGIVDFYDRDDTQFPGYYRDQYENLRTGCSALHLALTLKHKKIFEYLYHQGASLDTVDRAGFGENMLHTLIRQGDTSWFFYFKDLIVRNVDRQTYGEFQRMLVQETKECSEPIFFAAQQLQRFDFALMILECYKKFGVELGVMRTNALLTVAENYVKLEPRLREQVLKEQRTLVDFNLQPEGTDERATSKITLLAQFEKNLECANNLISLLSKEYRYPGKRNSDPEQEPTPIPEQKRFYGFSKKGPPKYQNKPTPRQGGPRNK